MWNPVQHFTPEESKHEQELERPRTQRRTNTPGRGLKSPGEEGDLADWCRDGHWGRGGIFHLFVLLFFPATPSPLLSLEGCCVVNNTVVFIHTGEAIVVLREWAALWGVK